MTDEDLRDIMDANARAAADLRVQHEAFYRRLADTAIREAYKQRRAEKGHLVRLLDLAFGGWRYFLATEIRILRARISGKWFR